MLGEVEKEEKSGECWADSLHSKSSMRTSGWAWWLHVWQHWYEEIITTHRRVRTYGGVVSLTHCKRCSRLHKHSSTRQYWFAAARPKGDKTFESKTVTDIHVTPCIALTHSWWFISMGVLRLHLGQSPKPTEIKVLKEKKVESWKYLFMYLFI